MPDEYLQSPWQDIRNKGYIHIRKFLTDQELEMLRDDWSEQSKAVKGSKNGNYPVVDVPQAIVWRFHRKVKAVTDAIRAVTGINADADAGGCVYYSTARGVNFPWHQDHEPYFVYQQSVDYLNFYIPIIKPDAKLTNICLISMDELESRIPERFSEYIGSGAKRFSLNQNGTHVYDDDNGSEYILPLNFEDIKVTPELVAGDLLLFRGDVLHRTQDAETPRVAVSFRRTSSTAIINKAKLHQTFSIKQEMMQKNWDLYKVLFECFDELNQDEITASQFHAYVAKRASA